MVSPVLLIRFALIPILTLATSVGCSSDNVIPMEDGTVRSQQAATTSDASVSSATDAGISATELARIQAYLDTRYTAKDVWRTFEAKSGQIIDCIDWFAQPSVKAMAAKGTPITTIPSPPPLPKGVAPASSIPDWAFNGAPDKNGVPRTCAGNSVPMIRVTVAEILAAGGLDAYTSAQRRLVAPDDLEYAFNYAHAREQFNGSGPGALINRGQSVLSINSPVIPNYFSTMFDHTLSQTWMTSGTGRDISNVCAPGYCIDPGAQTCTPGNCVQSVELGWWMSPGQSSTHFFIYATKDGYKNSCWGSWPCSDGAATPFTYFPGVSLTHGYWFPANPVGSTWQQYELPVVTYNLNSTWYIFALGSWIGWYDSAFFTGAMRNFGQNFRAGGEVYDQTGAWAVPMGSGASAVAAPNYLFRQAAYMHDFMACTANAGCSYDFSPMDVNNGGLARHAYNHSTGNPNPGVWNNAFFFGDAPGVFQFRQWAYNNVYAGQCGMTNNTFLTQPVIGLSKYFSGLQQAHAVLCGMQEIGDPNYPPCNGGFFTSGHIVGFGVTTWPPYNDQVCSSDQNWDPHIAKGDCACNEYVAGVWQGPPPTGNIMGILCCPGRYHNPQNGTYASLTHSNCNTQTFYSNNSNAYYDYSPDWDPSYYKGQCPAGQYVAGVSTVVNGSDGVVGAPHALLCCAQ